MRALCPLCPWRSDPQPIRDEPNGAWWASAAPASAYRAHFDRFHRPYAKFERGPMETPTQEPKEQK